MFDIGVD